jgi:GT2 family glycosyltransferase
MAAEPGSAGRTLSVSVVVFRQMPNPLATTVASLATAAARARAAGLLDRVTVWLIDNGGHDAPSLDRAMGDAIAEAAAPWLVLETIRGQGNVGYGRGHNLGISRSAADWHLVLNPDVVIDPDALVAGLRYLESHEGVALVTPRAEGEAGRQYLCKRYPSILVLGLRGFAPAWLRQRFRGALHRYEMRDLPDDAPTERIPIASGAFMLCRRDALEEIGGFSPEYFLYFEDFDLSLRLGRRWRIAYLPAMRIRHAGGEAAGKGWTHRRMFIRSGLTFFRRHGWRLW